MPRGFDQRHTKHVHTRLYLPGDLSSPITMCVNIVQLGFQRGDRPTEPFDMQSVRAMCSHSLARFHSDLRVCVCVCVRVCVCVCAFAFVFVSSPLCDTATLIRSGGDLQLGCATKHIFVLCDVSPGGLLRVGVSLVYKLQCGHLQHAPKRHIDPLLFALPVRVQPAILGR